MTPATAAASVRPQILARRNRLQAAAGSVSADYVRDLLAEVDAALARIDAGTWGICEICHDTIEADRLQANPMVRFCLDHLSASERDAHQQDLDLATQIQNKLLPPCDLTLKHWEAHYHYEPLGAVGGDYCAVTPLDEDGSLFIAVGDVSGKGVAASLLMTHLSAILRSLLSLRVPLPELMSRANRLFCEGTLGSHYATLVCGRATPARIELSNAGHCPPLVLRRDRVERVDCAGLPLGLFCGSEYPVTNVNLAAGESLVLYSDGLSEAENADGNQLGEAGLMDSLKRHCGAGAEALTHAVMQDVRRFRGSAHPADDVTLLVLSHRS